MKKTECLDAQFVAALTEHRAAMYRVAYAMLRSPHDAEDAVSAATVATYRVVERIHTWTSVKAYLLRVTVNEAHAILRRRKRERVETDETVLEASPVRAETPLWMYTHRLPVQMRIVLQLRYGENMHLDDIARVLRIPKGTVSSRLSRAQRQIQDRLRQEEEA